MLSASNTHEELSRRIKDATATMRELISIWGDDDGPSGEIAQCKSIIATITDLAGDYTVATGQYTCAISGGDAQPGDVAAYCFALNSGNFALRLSNAIAHAITLIHKHPTAYTTSEKRVGTAAHKNNANVHCYNFTDPNIARLHRRLTELTKTSSGVHVTATDADRCECGMIMSVCDDESYYICSACGKMQHIDGTAFRDEHCFAQDGAKNRNDNYHVMRHFEEWMPKILGIAEVTIPEELITKIKEVMIKSNILTTELNCKKARALLRNPKVKATYLNEHTTYLIKRLGGGELPVLTEGEISIIRTKYKIIAELYKTIDDSGVNQKYCPYFIYKIIEMFFADNPRVLSVNRYIHLQSWTTLRKNDAILKKIIAKTPPSDGFVFVATDAQRKF